MSGTSGMPETLEARVIASFRAIGGSGRPFLERARSLIARLTEVGGTHVGWDVMKVTFAFDASKFPAVLEAAMTHGPETQGDEPPWAVGLAQGDIRPVQEPGSPLMSSGVLWWGPPIVAATHLALLARPGEILCAQTIPALRSGDLITSGLRIARDGTLRVRGARIDTRQPWKWQLGDSLSRLVVPRYVTSHLPPVKLEPGALVVLRADPGAGGTRLLRELAAKAPRALIVSPTGSGYEPLGALRRALARSLGREVNPLLLELSGPLDDLLAGAGVSLDTASRLITAFLWPKQSGTNSALIIDDAKWVDPATLEACVRAVRKTPAFGAIVRLDATGGLPSVLAALPKGSEYELPTLSREGAEDVAVGCLNGALDPLARVRWARIGGGSPLSIVEAITQGIASGELTWSQGRACPRSRAAGRGKVKPAAKWIRLRANAEKTAVRVVLSLLAVLGGEAEVGFLERVLDNASIRIEMDRMVSHLLKARWVTMVQEGGTGRPERGWIAFPSRSHRDALFTTLEDDTKRKLHAAIAKTIEAGEGVFGRVEGAWHSAQAGDGVHAAKGLLEGARMTAEAQLEASTTQLIALARRVDPTCEEAALEMLATALARSPSVNPPPIAPAAQPAAAAPVPGSAPTAFVTRPSMRPPGISPPDTTRNPSMPPGSLSVPARIAAIASVPPTRHAMAAAAPPPPVVPRAPIAPTIDPAELAADEPDSMVERAVIVPPGAEDEDDSMVERAVIVARDHMQVPPTDRSASHPPQVEKLPTPPPPVAVAPPPPPPNASAPPVSDGNQIAARLGELAKDALLSSDNAALERWVDGLRAAGESPAFTERMRAMARLGRGDIGDALRVLRKTRSQLEPSDHRRRCQTSLALAVALSVAGRPQEALLEAMDALARARQVNDDRGAKACLAFLAKLYSAAQRDPDAERLRSASV